MIINNDVIIPSTCVHSPADDMDPKPADRSIHWPITDSRVFVRGASQVDQLLDPRGRRDHCSR